MRCAKLADETAFDKCVESCGALGCYPLTKRQSDQSCAAQCAPSGPKSPTFGTCMKMCEASGGVALDKKSEAHQSRSDQTAQTSGPSTRPRHAFGDFSGSSKRYDGLYCDVQCPNTLFATDENGWLDCVHKCEGDGFTGELKRNDDAFCGSQCLTLSETDPTKFQSGVSEETHLGSNQDYALS